MTIYTFTCSCGHTREINRPMSNPPKWAKCKICGNTMHRDLQIDFGKQYHGDIWPMESYAAGVHHKQIPEMRAFDKKHNVPTDYTPDGDPVFRGPKHRRKYCEAHGLFDRNAGLSDPVPARCK